MGRGQRASAIRIAIRSASSSGKPDLLALARAHRLSSVSLQELHDEKRGARVLADVEERADVRMGEFRDVRASRSKRSRNWWVGGQRLGSTLIATVRSRRVSRLLHLAHATNNADLGGDLRAESGTGSQSHADLVGL